MCSRNTIAYQFIINSLRSPHVVNVAQFAVYNWESNCHVLLTFEKSKVNDILLYELSWLPALEMSNLFYAVVMFTLRGRKLKTELYFYLSSVPTNPSRKRRFTKTLFKPGNLKTLAFDFTMTMICPCPCFTQTQIHIEWPVIVAFSNFSIVWTKTFDAFSKWNLRFQIPSA